MKTNRFQVSNTARVNSEDLPRDQVKQLYKKIEDLMIVESMLRNARMQHLAAPPVALKIKRQLQQQINQIGQALASRHVDLAKDAVCIT